MLLGPAALLPPAHIPGPATAGSVLALALASTALGFALFYRLVARFGPTGALSVTFLVPVFGLTWGALFLDEPFTASTGVGLALVLVSVALVARAPTPPTASPSGNRSATRDGHRPRPGRP